MLKHKIIIEPFCYKQFDQKSASQIIFDREKFQAKVNEIYDANQLKDGYAPFCKHLFIENFTETPNYTIRITPENEQLLRSAYRARTEKEVYVNIIKLPVLVRYFEKHHAKLEKAKYLNLILYSREQVELENKTMGNEVVAGDYDYAIVSIKPQDIDYEIPMNPITMMRNALGVEHGGSGVGLDREKYAQSVEFWKNHALVE